MIKNEKLNTLASKYFYSLKIKCTVILITTKKGRKKKLLQILQNFASALKEIILEKTNNLESK